jgi:hypothetical protein
MVMNDSKRLAEQIQKALEGGAWHGPSWREALDGVTREAALARPITSAHTIVEIVRHATTWHDVVRRRLNGESPQVSDAEDWPDGPIPDDAAWTKTVLRLLETGDQLRKTVGQFPAERLHDQRPGIEDTWHGLIMGELQHILYHAGQVAILRKASAKQ